jgi:type IV pilus assembly protein PilA
MTCPYCGTEVVAGNRFCHQCKRQVAEGGNKVTMVVLLVVGGVVVFFGGIVVIGIIAAIAIPSLLRARISANEAVAIGDLRTVMSAEVAYHEASNGRYGTIPCLSQPAQCISGYSGPNFLDSTATLSAKQGYEKELTLSRNDRRFVYIATPKVWNQTGVRGFCADSTGFICYTPNASALLVRDGACDPESCQAFQ